MSIADCFGNDDKIATGAEQSLDLIFWRHGDGPDRRPRESGDKNIVFGDNGTAILDPAL